MGSELPSIAAEVFARELAAHSPLPLSASTLEALHLHYLELQRWNRRLSLVGPGTARDVLGRHYGESLAALPLIGDGVETLVDLGSGGGFPGLVLAAARPDLEVALVEARERKAIFLATVIRRAALSCRSLNARVGPRLPAGLPERVDVVTSRALRLSPQIFELFLEHSPRVRFLLWTSAASPLPPGWVAAGHVDLAGSDRRRILDIRRR